MADLDIPALRALAETTIAGQSAPVGTLAVDPADGAVAVHVGDDLWRTGGVSLLSGSRVVDWGYQLEAVPVSVADLLALLAAAEQWEQPTAAAWKRARLERDALRRDRDRLRRAISDFLATYTLHADITRGLAAALTASGDETDD